MNVFDGLVGFFQGPFDYAFLLPPHAVLHPSFFVIAEFILHSHRMFLLESHVEGVGDVMAKMLLGTGLVINDWGLFCL